MWQVARSARRERWTLARPTCNISARIEQSSLCTSDVEDGDLLARYEIPQGCSVNVDHNLILKVVTWVGRVERMINSLFSNRVLVHLARSQEDGYETLSDRPILDAPDGIQVAALSAKVVDQLHLGKGRFESDQQFVLDVDTALLPGSTLILGNLGC